jgi:hypothetical protein
MRIREGQGGVNKSGCEILLAGCYAIDPQSFFLSPEPKRGWILSPLEVAAPSTAFGGPPPPHTGEDQQWRHPLRMGGPALNVSAPQGRNRPRH